MPGNLSDGESPQPEPAATAPPSKYTRLGLTRQATGEDAAAVVTDWLAEVRGVLADVLGATAEQVDGLVGWVVARLPIADGERFGHKLTEWAAGYAADRRLDWPGLTRDHLLRLAEASAVDQAVAELAGSEADPPAGWAKEVLTLVADARPGTADAIRRFPLPDHLRKSKLVVHLLDRLADRSERLRDEWAADLDLTA